MRLRSHFFALFAIILLFASITSAQKGLPDIGIRKNLAVGIVSAVGEQKIVLATKDGPIDAVLVKTTKFKRLSPDNLDLGGAVEASLADVGVDDRVLVTGEVSADRKSIVTTSVYLVKGSDIAEQQRKARMEWRRRGISGKVKTVDHAGNTILVEMRGVTGLVSSLSIRPKEDSRFLRYASTSVRYSDAVKSSITDIAAGDMIQALGDKSEDGKSFAAEEIITGAFLTVAGPVKSVDAARKEVTISDLRTKKDVTISVTPTSLLKRFPEQIAQRLARFQLMMRMRAAGGGGQRREGAGGGRPGGKRSARPGGGRMGGDINDMLNRFPTITVADLKKGDMIAVSSPKGKDPLRFTAIKLLAGVEPFLVATQLPSGRGRRGGRGVSGGLSIPGLESVEF